MDATEMMMLRHIYEDHFENTEIRRQAGMKKLSSSMREKRLQWHSHVVQGK